MQRILIALAVLIFAAPAMAQTWYTANQVTFAWDQVPKVIGTDQPNKYQVYSRNDAVSLGNKIGGEITATQLLVAFTVEGSYYLGVEVIRYPAGETTGIQSEKAWSNVAEDTASGVPFGVMYFAKPGSAIGLKLIQ